MANKDAAMGLKVHKHGGGGTVRMTGYKIASAYTVSIFSGDPVITSGTGKEVQIGTAGGNIVGVFAGCEYTTTDGVEHFSRYWPASTTLKTGTKGTAWVYDDPQIQFVVQAVTDGTGITAAMIGQLADLTIGTGSTATGQSTGELTAPAGAETQVRILELLDHPNNAYGEHAKVVVQIGEHELLANSANEGLSEV